MTNPHINHLQTLVIVNIVDNKYQNKDMLLQVYGLIKTVLQLIIIEI